MQKKHEGGSIKHDISMPVAAIPAFIDEANAAVIAVVPGARPMPFGHVGDGNIHYNISQPDGMDKAAFMAREDDSAGRGVRASCETRRLDLGRARHRHRQARRGCRW